MAPPCNTPTTARNNEPLNFINLRTNNPPIRYPKMKKTHKPLIAVQTWIRLAAGLLAAPAFAAENPNLAARAEITASVESFPGAAAKVADGLLPGPGNRDDGRSVWVVKEANDLPASLVFTWKAPVTVSTVVYYGRSRAGGFQVFKDYAVYLDDADKPVVEGAFLNGHGPQPVTLPAPVQVRKLRLEFRSQHGG